MDFYFSGKDLTIKDDRFALAVGAKYSADHFYDGLGGGAANVGVNASSLGLNTAIVGKIGENSFKQIMLQKLIRKRVSTEFIVYDKDYYNLSSILVTPKGERTVIHHATPHNTINLSELQLKNLINTKAVYIGHLPGIALEERSRIIKYFKDRDILIVINFGLDDVEKHPKSLVNYINNAGSLVINADEFSAFLGIKKE